MKTYIVSFLENRSIEIEANNETEAEEIVKSGEFEERFVESESVDLSSVEAREKLAD